MNESYYSRRDMDYADRDPDPEYFDEMEETYRDGSLKNECWDSRDLPDASFGSPKNPEERKERPLYISTPLYINDNLRRTYDTVEMVHDYAVSEQISEKDERCVGLLVEETIGMVAAMVGGFEGEIWLEGDQKGCDVCLEGKILPILSGFEIPKGFMAKVGQILHCSFLFDNTEEVPDSLRSAIPDYIMSGIGRLKEGGLMVGKWSLTACRKELKEKAASFAEAREALDEMEMSVVANLADEVTVGLREEGKIRLVISKSFAKKDK